MFTGYGVMGFHGPNRIARKEVASDPWRRADHGPSIQHCDWARMYSDDLGIKISAVRKMENG